MEVGKEGGKGEMERAGSMPFVPSLHSLPAGGEIGFQPEPGHPCKDSVQRRKQGEMEARINTSIKKHQTKAHHNNHQVQLIPN